MSKTMQAVVLHGREDLRLETVAVPQPGPGELLLRVGAALTCGTDLKVYRRGYHAKMLVPPTLFGHEIAGTVISTGADVAGFEPGDRVVALNSAPCGACLFCRRDQPNLCSDLLFNNGAYAEYIRIPARIVAKNTLHVPNDVPFQHAALTEPLACVVHGLEQCNPRTGDTVVVIGAGPIGLMFLRTAQIAGCRVIAVVKRDDQIVSAKRFGADEVVQIAEGVDTVAAVRALTEDGEGADIVVECVATPATWEQSVEMVRKGGVVNLFGGPPSGTTVSFDTNRLHYGDIMLKATFHHTPAACRRAFELITSGRMRAEDFITATTGLSDVPDVFRRMLVRSATGTLDIKTAVLPEVVQ
ncbi:zinc-dependent alcohol dehydrogenase [Terriglobus roseus]|uniref:L-iditol 2-dehydrogenase n=1 Tax=Terriglobus roseus TaxID=392734 RepID=A0A1H4ITC3_9BACT|nr:zinc-binding dehydrogenase [Terriglobus roseus]SEB36896.1 L-iditol 2-dehydrogenase [Terriglobus roseus]